MPDKWFSAFLVIVLLLFGGSIGVVLLIWPSKFLRHFQNPWQPDTPVNRVYTRALGVFVCSFVLVPISWSMTTFKGFDQNILLALWTLPVLMPIFLWILWRYSPLKQVNRRYLAGGEEEPEWELRMSVAFCSLLSMIVVVAMLLAMIGIYPKAR
jgi:hypothetical protein